ncbi:MAG: inositol monophosphatase [Rhizobiales bacterium]|nr:inositol monophosphatase [Hyphomicrobiales bacterium]MBI3671997.1 inositol monophosphatase [Hyphomicrobiales bacterium]
MAASPALTVMIAAVRKAARGVQRDYGELANLQVSLKAPGDYVTAADHRCDKVLRQELAKARPGYSFLTEETGLVKGSDPDHRFIIDPIDGTTNFMHAVPIFAINVALERKGEIVAAVTYNPVSDELFTAEKGAGAFLNNKRLRVAQRKDIHEALVAYEVPHRGGPDLPLSRAELAVLQGKVIGIRGLGSSAMALAFVAAGRLDAFICRNLNQWDMAPGMLLMREAGGFTSDVDGEASPMVTGNILAANAELMPQIKQALAAARV